MKMLASLATWLELAGLALWVGGMVTLGALVAPIVFDTVRPAQIAGEAMSLVFRKFNGGLVYVSIAMVLIGFIGKMALSFRRGSARWIEGSLLVLMTLIGLYIGGILGPRMQALREVQIQDPSNTQAIVEFDRGHRLSERLFTFNMILGLGVLFINARELAASGGDSRTR